MPDLVGRRIAVFIGGGFEGSERTGPVRALRHAGAQARPMAAVCHGPQLRISAGVLRNRTLTCYRSVRDDVIYAAARYVDEPAVVDGHLITSRRPGHLPAVSEAIIDAVAQQQSAARS